MNQSRILAIRKTGQISVQNFGLSQSPCFLLQGKLYELHLCSLFYLLKELHNDLYYCKYVVYCIDKPKKKPLLSRLLRDLVLKNEESSIFMFGCIYKNVAWNFLSLNVFSFGVRVTFF